MIAAGITLRRRVLLGLQKGMYWSGAGAAYSHVARPTGAIILMYHSVARTKESRWIDPRNRVAPALFDAQMRFLARYRFVVSVSRLVEMLDRGEPIARRTVAITFDDGYADTLTVAVAILEKYGLPMTLFLPTGYIARAEPQWNDRLYSTFMTRREHELAIAGQGWRFDLRRRDERSEAYRLVSMRLRSALRAERDALLSELARQLRPAGLPPRLTLTWEEVRLMTKRFPLVEIGVHTVDHIDLQEHGGDTARSEVEGSIADVKRELGVSPRHLSFPYGRFDDDTRQCASQLGLRSALATEPVGLVNAHSDRYCLPRVATPGSMSLFRFWTSGAYPSLPLALTGRA